MIEAAEENEYVIEDPGPVVSFEGFGDNSLTLLLRAFIYNLDYRLTLMEEALANRQLDVSRYDLLPEVTANAGYTSRNNFSGAASRSLPMTVCDCPASASIRSGKSRTRRVSEDATRPPQEVPPPRCPEPGLTVRRRR